MSRTLSEFPIKSRVRVALTTTAAVIAEVDVNGDVQKLEKISVNNTTGSGKTTTFAIVAAGETYAASSYDISTARALAANTSGSVEGGPWYLQPGDKVYALASAAGVNAWLDFGAAPSTTLEG